MIDVDVESYLALTDQRPENRIRYGMRVVQWAGYVQRRIPRLTAAQEFKLLGDDAKVMGSTDWWKNA